MRAQETPLIHMEQLAVSYGDKPVLSGIDLDIESGEVLAMTGPSGVGKSTLGLVLSGMLTDYSGTLTVDGLLPRNLNREELRRYRGEKVAMVGQDPRQVFDPLFTVGWQVIETLRSHFAMDRHMAEQKVLNLLLDLDLSAPERIMGAWPHELSGGTLLRAALAMVLALEPVLVVADEVTAALDTIIGLRVLDLMKQIVPGPHRALLLITHDIRAAVRIADRIVVMRDGMLYPMNVRKAQGDIVEST